MSSPSTRYLIGVTGLNSSGKSTLCNYFQSLSFKFLSLSDALRAELRERKLEITRQNLHSLGNELRLKEGPGTLSKRIVRLFDDQSNYIIDSVRHPKEVEILKATKGFKTILIGCSAPVKHRWDLLVARNRTGDCKTFQEFLENEKLELKNPDPNGQQIGLTLELADFSLSNDGTLKEFETKVVKLWKEIESQQNSKNTPSSSFTENQVSKTSTTCS